MAALDNVLAEQRAETKFGRDVKLAGIRASGSDQTKPVNFSTALLREMDNIRSANKQNPDPKTDIPEDQIYSKALENLKLTPAYKDQVIIEQQKILTK